MEKVIIIAEAGVNHNGNIELAKQLVDIASDCGADYVKFQTFKTELIVDKSAQKAHYQIVNDGESSSQYEMIKKLELPFENFIYLQKYCHGKGIKFLTTLVDLYSLGRVNELNLDFIKIASGEITNIPFLRQVAMIKKPIILSTGMSNLGEIENALKVLTSRLLSINDITILHCNTDYPTAFEDVNLKAMNTIREAFKVKVGYSDHTLGIEVSLAAVAMGASVIEKHFTINKNMKGPDHKCSLDPDELSLLVNSVRNIEKALLGDGRKEPSNSESKNKVIVRKSLFTSKKISQGEILTEDCLIVKRPGDGMSSNDIDLVIGKSVNSDLPEGHKINYKDIVW